MGRITDACRRQIAPTCGEFAIWAAGPTLTVGKAAHIASDDSGVPEILAGAEPLPPEDRAAIETGAARGAADLEGEGRLTDEAFRLAVDVGLRSSRGSFRLEALKLLARREPDLARAKAQSDPDAKVRRWAERSASSTGSQHARTGMSHFQ